MPWMQDKVLIVYDVLFFLLRVVPVDYSFLFFKNLWNGKRVFWKKESIFIAMFVYLDIPLFIISYKSSTSVVSKFGLMCKIPKFIMVRV